MKNILEAAERGQPADGPDAGFNLRPAWTGSSNKERSPDIIVAPGAAAFDTSGFTDSDNFHWDFTQVASINAANAVYVRAVNYTQTGAQVSTVYFYAVQSDAVLDPSKWSSTGFTVNGAAGNASTLTAQALYQIVASDHPVGWQPASPDTGSSWILIACISDATPPVPPTFPSTPFAAIADLDAYIDKSNGKLAILDTSYLGTFLRQFPGQLPTQVGTGAQTAIDLIVTGSTAAQDASAFASTASYAGTTLANQVTYGVPNFIYLRGLNSRPTGGSARVYFYFTLASSPSPIGWRIDGFSVAGQTQNWLDLTATAAGEIDVPWLPIVWTPPTPGNGDSLILIAYVNDLDNGGPVPPNLTPFGYLTLPTVTKFVAATPRISWLAISGSASQTTATSVQTATASPAGGKYYVGMELANLPTDGKLTLSIPGPNAANTVVAAFAPPAPDAVVVWPVTWPANFTTAVVMTYTQGATTPVGPPNFNAILLPG